MLYIHFCIYLLTFIISYTSAYNDWYHNTMCVLMGWAIFGFVSVGHELYHLRSRSWYQSLLAFLCLDLWVVSGKVWVERHNKFHHVHVWELDNDEDEHMVAGGFLVNFWHAMVTLATTYRALKPSWSNTMLNLVRLYIFTRISYSAMFIVYTTVMLCVTYLTFIAHAAPVIIKDTHQQDGKEGKEDKESYNLKQMHRAVDIFPGSWWFSLLCGGFNTHAAHHLSPYETRDGLFALHTIYKNKYANDYRYVSTWYQLWQLYCFSYYQLTSMDDWFLLLTGKLCTNVENLTPTTHTFSFLSSLSSLFISIPRPT